MRVCYSAGYRHRHGPHGVFPVGKNVALHDLLRREGLLSPEQVHEPGVVSYHDLAEVHTTDYLDQLRSGELDVRAQRRFGLPFNAEVLDRARHTVAGSIDAGRIALDDGLAANLAGGSHHARPDAAAGYCLLNDVAVAIRVLRREGRIRRALIIDLDVHQGDGNALFFRDDPDVFTFSVHARRNFPARKVPSSLDLSLEDGVADDEYLALLDEHLPAVVDRARPDLAFYLAGVDPHLDDRLGRLALGREGLHLRDRRVFAELWRRGLPAAVVLAGGYGATVEETADLHAVTFRELARLEASSLGV